MEENKCKVVFEKCVCCGKETDIPVAVPIYNRNYYVEGAGQLCKECHDKIYD